MYGQVSLLECCHSDNLEIINGDVRDHELVHSKLPNADLIIPLACLVGAPLCDKKPLEAQSINYDAIKSLLSSRSSDQRIIFPTTNSGYGIGEKGKYCTEETPLNPVSFYGKLKVELEKDLLAENNTITLRLATVFGISPRMRIDLLVNDFVYRAVNDRFIVLYQSHFMRNYIHVRDVADAFNHSIDHFDSMKGEAYNVGLSDANMNKYQLCEKIKEQLPNFHFVKAEIGEDPDKRDYLVSNEKIEKTGFKPKRSMEQGIEELIKGYQILKRNQFTNMQ